MTDADEATADLLDSSDDEGGSFVCLNKTAQSIVSEEELHPLLKAAKKARTADILCQQVGEQGK